MKKLIILIIAISLTSCFTYKTLSVDKPFEYVTTHNGQSQSELFLKANDWMVSIFNNAESVIEYSDKDKGVIIGKYLMYGTIRESGNMYVSSTLDTRVYAKINIFVKDNVVKLTIKPIGTWQYNKNTIYGFTAENAKNKSDKLAESLNSALNSKLGW